MRSIFVFISLLGAASCSVGSVDSTVESDKIGSFEAIENTRLPESYVVGDEYKFQPDWKKGDGRYARMKSRIVTSSFDREDDKITGDFLYSIRVLEVSDVYKVELFQTNMAMPLINSHYGEDWADHSVDLINRKARELTNAFPFLLTVNKESGKVKDVLNREEFIKALTNLSDSLLLKHIEGRNVDVEVMKKVAHELYLENAEKKIQSIILCTNYLLQIYGRNCIIDGEKSEQTILDDNNTLGRFSGGEMPAMSTIRSSKAGDQIEVEIDYDLEPLDFLDAMNGKYRSLDEAGVDNMSMSQSQKIEFDMSTSWPKKMESTYKLNVDFPDRNKGVKTIEIITTAFSKKP